MAGSDVAYLFLGPLSETATGRAEDEAAFLDALGGHAPSIEPDPPDGCWLALRAGRRAPPPAALGAALLATAAEWGYPAARLGVAPTPGVARLAARHGRTNPTVLDHAGVAAFLGPLPLDRLALDEPTLARLALVGLRTLGAVAALPRGSLGDYLGAAGPALEALARGEDDRPLVPLRPPLVLAARRDLDFALDDRRQLAALVGRLLAPLLAQLRRQGLGATRVTLTLTAGARRAARVAVPLAAPTSDPAAVLGPLLAALPDHGAGGEGEAQGVTGVRVALTAPRPLAGRQASLFDVPQGRRGRLRLGMLEARRRTASTLGYLRPVEPAHPLPERRYRLDAGAVPGDERPGGA